MKPQTDYEEMFRMQQNTEMLEKYLQDMELQLQDLEVIKNTLNDFEKEKKETEILVPIVNGIFFKAKITDNSKFLVNIGTEGIVTEMSVNEVKGLILKQIERTKENKNLVTTELSELLKKLKYTQ
jgi:prefoldin alpha subunit